MKKRLLSLLLVLAVVFSFSLSAFATDTGIDIIDDPLSYYFENQMLGVQKGTGVTLVCPKCDYKVVYTGGTLVTCPYDGEALVLADLAGVHAEKVPSGIGRKDLPGYIDNSGTAHVSKEGKLKFVAHPCWLDVGEQESNKFTLTDPYKPYRVQEEDEDYGLYVYDWLGYNNGISHFSLYTQPLSDDMYYGNFDFYWIIDSGFVPGTYYVAADQPTVKNFYSKYGAEPQILKTKAGEYNLPNDSYWGLGNLGLSDYNAVWHERRWFYAENAKSTSIDIYLYPFLVTCDPTENPVEEKKEVTIEDNKFTGNIYVDNSTNITYIYPKYTTVNVNNETVIEVADHPLIYNPESKTYYVYDQTTNNYYYISIPFSRVQYLHTMVTILANPSTRSTVDIIVNTVLNTVNLQTRQPAVISDSVVRSAILFSSHFQNLQKQKRKKKKRDKVFRVFPLGNRTCLSVPLVPQKRKRKSPLSGATAYSSSDSSKSLKDAKPTMFAM